MGGLKSGRKRSANRGAVEQYPAIDLRILRRAGLLRAGECTYDTLQWRNQASNALSARIFIDLSDPECAWLRIIVSACDGTIKSRIEIACVPCPFGGIRCYFICPLNATRCEQLFLVSGIFASRNAHSLSYAVQSENQLSRARRKVRKLHRQVDGDIRYVRPRGRNRWQKVQQLKIAERDARDIYHERLRSMTKNFR